MSRTQLYGITVRAKGFPAWTVPALEIDGRKIQGTRAIAGEIDRLAPGSGLFPADPARRRVIEEAERYVREWLNAQAAGGFVAYDPDSGRYSMLPEQTVALTDPDSPAYLPGFFQIALGSVIDSPKIIERARSGDGFG
jgi:hypothetical protein